MGEAGQKIYDYSLEYVLAEVSDIYDLYLSRKSTGMVGSLILNFYLIV